MKRLALVLAATVALGLPAGAWAQAAAVDWADVDCSQSRIWPTMGLHCRATSALTNDALSTGQGMFRFWNAAGTVEDVKYYYYVAEAVHPTSVLAAKHGWVLYATRCVPPGEQVTERDIDRFVREARLRE
jgi:hypothetical protein